MGWVYWDVGCENYEDGYEDSETGCEGSRSCASLEVASAVSIPCSPGWVVGCPSWMLACPYWVDGCLDVSYT